MKLIVTVFHLASSLITLWCTILGVLQAESRNERHKPKRYTGEKKIFLFCESLNFVFKPFIYFAVTLHKK